MRFQFFCVFSVVSLIGISGCQTTQQAVNHQFSRSLEASYTRQQELQIRNDLRAHVTQVIKNVCFEHIGEADRIDRVAESYAVGSSFLDATMVAGEWLKVKLYPLATGRFGEVVLVNGGGVTCGLSADRKLRLPQYLRGELGITMEKPVWDMFNYEDVDVTYGYMRKPDYPLRQYSMRDDDNNVIDVVEFMAPEAFREDVVFNTEFDSMMERQIERSDMKTADVALDVINNICIPHLYAPEAMRDSAIAYSGTQGNLVSNNDQYFLGRQFSVHVLSLEGEGQMSFLSMLEDAGGCGFWKIGGESIAINIFEHYGTQELETYVEGQSLGRVGYVEELDLILVEELSDVDGEHGHGIIVMGQALLEELQNQQDRSILPGRI